MRTIFGSHGHVLANDAGEVVGFDSRDNNDGSANDAYGDIARFDFAEWRKHYAAELPAALDILDIGYWTLAGDYEPADEFHRQMVSEGCGSMAATKDTHDFFTR